MRHQMTQVEQTPTTNKTLGHKAKHRRISAQHCGGCSRVRRVEQLALTCVCVPRPAAGRQLVELQGAPAAQERGTIPPPGDCSPAARVQKS